MSELITLLSSLFFTFFKIGAFTFGGGYAMLPLIQQAVLEKGWLTPQQVIDFVAVSESTPGPFAVNMATYVGTEQMTEVFGGLWGLVGGAVATLGVILPSFIIILIVARIFDAFKSNKHVKACMYGLKAAVPGLIGVAVLSMVKTVFLPFGFEKFSLADVSLYISLAIFAVAAFLVFKKKTHPIIIICLSAVVGIIAGFALNLTV